MTQNTEMTGHPEIDEIDFIEAGGKRFYIEKSRGGLYKSVMEDGADFLFALTEDAVRDMTVWHLECEADGTLEKHSRVVLRDSTVGGKL